MALKSNMDFLTFYDNSVVKKIKKITFPLFERGIISFGYNKLFPNGDRIILENNTEWLYTFFKSELYKDVVDQQKVIEMMERAPNNKVYGYLWPHKPLTLTQDILFTHQKVWNGVSVIKKSSTWVELYHFGAEKNNKGVLDFYLNNFEFLKNFIRYFSFSSLNILNKEDRCFLKGYFLPFSLSKEVKVTNDMDVDQKPTFINLSSSFLTKREKECLDFLSKGKTAKEIAHYLGISVRTVECYLITLKRKFGAHTLAELLFLSAVKF